LRNDYRPSLSLMNTSVLRVMTPKGQAAMQ
jgi:hypothetical protein